MERLLFFNHAAPWIFENDDFLQQSGYQHSVLVAELADVSDLGIPCDVMSTLQ